MKNQIITDERMQIISGRISMIFLALTQLALLGVILVRRYYLGQGDEYYNDIRIILGISVFGSIAARLFYGAVLPMISLKKLLIIYAAFVITLTIILSIWFGLPTLDTWQVTILPVLLGPAILLGAYWLFAWLGLKRMEKDIE